MINDGYENGNYALLPFANDFFNEMLHQIMFHILFDVEDAPYQINKDANTHCDAR